MKKKYLLFFLFSCLSFFGQTYDFNVNSGILCNTCWQGTQGPTYNSYEATEFFWSVKNNGITIASGNNNGFIPNGKIATSYTKILSIGSTFVIGIHSTGTYTPDNSSFYTCNANISSAAQTIENLIITGSTGYFDSPCGINANITLFKPNLAIKNLDTTNPNSVCAGFQLSLNAFSSTNDDGMFPDVAYHWQYSLDGTTWSDVPTFTPTNVKINNIAISKFTIQEILGNAHVNYFDKQIYFRMGYGQNRPFSSPFAITYLACAPVAQYINYEAPKCNGNNIEKIEVFFKEKLKTGEDLSIIYVVNTDPAKTTPRFQNTTLVTSFTLDSATNLYKYSFLNLDEALENGNFYTVKYQARLNGQPMGSLQVSQQPFQYIDPAKMQFKITGQTQPTCFGAEDATIDIEILSGESPYNFYVENVLKTASKIDNLHYKILGLKANVLGYKIKVTDKNDCIEKAF